MSEDSIVIDSEVLAHNVVAQELPVHFLNSSHDLMPGNTVPLVENIDFPDWILSVFVLVFMVLAWVRFYHTKRAKMMIKAFASRLYVVLLLRESDSLMIGLSIALNFVFILVVSLFLYLITSYHSVHLPFSDVINPFFVFAGLLVLLYQAKAFVLWILGIIFKESEKFYEYIFNVFLFNKMLGLILLPVVIGITYLKIGTQYLIYAGLFLMLVIYLYRIYRGVIICIRKANLSQSYIFLYLCTLEILPIAVITRFISANL